MASIEKPKLVCPENLTWYCFALKGDAMTLTQLMQALWAQYTEITPSAEKIHALLGKNKGIVNDHCFGHALWNVGLML